MISSKTRQVQLPCQLCEEAERQFGADFASVDELLAFVLEALLKDPTAPMGDSEQAVIEKRLRDLGYL